MGILSLYQGRVGTGLPGRVHREFGARGRYSPTPVGKNPVPLEEAKSLIAFVAMPFFSFVRFPPAVYLHIPESLWMLFAHYQKQTILFMSTIEFINVCLLTYPNQHPDQLLTQSSVTFHFIASQLENTLCISNIILIQELGHKYNESLYTSMPIYLTLWMFCNFLLHA